MGRYVQTDRTNRIIIGRRIRVAHKCRTDRIQRWSSIAKLARLRNVLCCTVHRRYPRTKVEKSEIAPVRGPRALKNRFDICSGAFFPRMLLPLGVPKFPARPETTRNLITTGHCRVIVSVRNVTLQLRPRPVPVRTPIPIIGPWAT